MMEDFYKAISTPEQASRELADFVCSMMRAAASEQSLSPINKSCEAFASLMRTLSYIEGMSRHDLISGAAAVMRERAEEVDDSWADIAARGTMHYAELCSSRDGFSRARRATSKGRLIDSVRVNRDCF